MEYQQHPYFGIWQSQETIENAMQLNRKCKIQDGGQNTGVTISQLVDKLETNSNGYTHVSRIEHSHGTNDMTTL